jgi:hypothetical protein
VTTFQKFEDIEAWQMARRVAFEIYGASKQLPFAKVLAFKDKLEMLASRLWPI